MTPITADTTLEADAGAMEAHSRTADIQIYLNYTLKSPYSQQFLLLCGLR